MGAQDSGDLRGAAEVGAVGADHGKVLRATQQDALDERQDHLEMEQIERPKPPPFRIRRLDHGKDATGLQHARDQGRQLRMLRGVECLQSERGDDEIRALRRQVAGQQIILDEFDPMGTVGVQPLHGATVHAGRDIDRRDRANMVKALQQMRPDLAGPRHQIIAAHVARPKRGHRRHTLLAPALGESE